MPTESLEVSWTLPAKPEDVYEAWLDGETHSRFTGGTASVEPRAGGRFTAWDGYIQGTTLALEPGRRIVQAWRTSEFPEGSPDSRLDVFLEAAGGGTRVTLRHSNIPEGQGEKYRGGWNTFYSAPMKRYFRGLLPASPKPAAKKAVAKKPAAKKPAAKKAVAKKAVAKKAAARGRAGARMR